MFINNFVGFVKSLPADGSMS